MILALTASLMSTLPYRCTESDTSGFHFLGGWSNIVALDVGEEESEVKGIKIELWHSGPDTIIGRIAHYAGQPSDPPVGIIEDGRLDRESRRLTFSAKLSLGRVWDKETSSWVPSKDLYRFTGSLDGNTLSGSLVHVSVGISVPPDSTTLRIAKSPLDRRKRPRCRRAWKEESSILLERLGPKW